MTQTQKSSKNPIHVTIIVLVILGVLSFATRTLFESNEQIPEGDTFWKFRWTVQIEAFERGTSLRLFPPINTKNARVIAQEFFHPGLRIQRTYNQLKPTREIRVKSGSAGRYVFEAQFTIHVRPTEEWSSSAATEPKTDQASSRYLAATEFIQVDDPSVRSALSRIGAIGKSDKEIQSLINKFISRQIKQDPEFQIYDAIATLKAKRSTDLGRARTIVAMYRAAKIPARIVTGFIMADNFDARPQYWVEFRDVDHWNVFDPKNRIASANLPDYVPFRRNNADLLTTEIPAKLLESFQISPQPAPQGLLTRELQFTDIFRLERLPEGLRDTLYILLLLPFGTVITVAFRTFIGVRTYGTFTPTLIALAFVKADLVTAFVILTLVSIIGFAGRAYLPRLDLARTPRLSIVFTIVALSVTLGVSILDYFEFHPPGYIVLLPIVVLTTLIDRVYGVMDENGLRVALVRLFWTGVIALLCFFLFQIDFLAAIVISNPEVHFFAIALVLLIGIYKGKSLFEYFPINPIPEKLSSEQPDTTAAQKKTKRSI